MKCLSVTLKEIGYRLLQKYNHCEYENFVTDKKTIITVIMKKL